MGPEDAILLLLALCPLAPALQHRNNHTTTATTEKLDHRTSEIEPKSTNRNTLSLAVASWEMSHFGAWESVGNSEVLCIC
jgi:hypothetical protein